MNSCYWFLSSVSFYELPFYFPIHSTSSGELSSSGPLNMDSPHDSVLWSIFESIFPIELMQFISEDDSQVHISMPSTSPLIQLPPWHSHWIAHSHLTLHLPRAPNALLSLLVFLKVAPLSYSPSWNHQYPRLQASASLIPFSCSNSIPVIFYFQDVSPLAPFSPFPLWWPKSKLASFYVWLPQQPPNHGN